MLQHGCELGHLLVEEDVRVHLDWSWSWGLLLRRRLLRILCQPPLSRSLHDLVDGGQIRPDLVDLSERVGVLVRLLREQVEHLVRELLRSLPFLLHILTFTREDIIFIF